MNETVTVQVSPDEGYRPGGDHPSIMNVDASKVIQSQERSKKMIIMMMTLLLVVAGSALIVLMIVIAKPDGDKRS
jgi:hypothetical protein